MKKKIGVVTFYKDNFGSILQCYATKYIVKKLGYECNVLSENAPIQKVKNNVVRKIKRLIFIVYSTLKDPTFINRWQKIHKEPFPLVRESWDKMDDFVEKELCPIGCTEEELLMIGKEYYAFIVGSDQVWNANNKISDLYFLKFAPDYKKIAFSVSFGTDKPSFRFLNKIKSGIKGFEKISVREETGIKIVNAISNVAVERVADPTIMLSANEWSEFCSDVVIKTENYILVHFLNYPSDLAIAYIEKMRDNREVICMAYRYSVFEKKGWHFVNCGPKEYVKYISLADEVYTDSFHTTVLSINFSKNFYTFEREYLHSNPQTSRIIDLLIRYDLLDRFVMSMDHPKALNKKRIHNKLEREKYATIQYLKEALIEVNE